MQRDGQVRDGPLYAPCSPRDIRGASRNGRAPARSQSSPPGPSVASARVAYSIYAVPAVPVVPPVLAVPTVPAASVVPCVPAVPSALCVLAVASVRCAYQYPIILTNVLINITPITGPQNISFYLCSFQLQMSILK